VHALRDGVVLMPADRLVALLSSPNRDRALVERGLESQRRSCSLIGAADRALLTLVWLSDELESVEFPDNGVFRKPSDGSWDRSGTRP
jgi:hypothetical protein